MITYNVTVKTDNGKTLYRTYNYKEATYPHSSHLVDIMQALDSEYLTLTALEVLDSPRSDLLL